MDFMYQISINFLACKVSSRRKFSRFHKFLIPIIIRKDINSCCSTEVDLCFLSWTVLNPDYTDPAKPNFRLSVRTLIRKPNLSKSTSFLRPFKQVILMGFMYLVLNIFFCFCFCFCKPDKLAREIQVPVNASFVLHLYDANRVLLVYFVCWLYN